MGRCARWIGGLLLGAWLVAAPAWAAPALTPWAGGATPGLSLHALDAGSQTLAGYRGKVVLINFWATWCEPCRLEMPSMQRLRDRLGSDRFEVLAVNVDEPDARVRAFLKQTGLKLTVLMDPNKTVTRDWGVRFLPVSFILGPDGRIRYRVVGDLDWDNDTVVGTINQLLSGG